MKKKLYESRSSEDYHFMTVGARGMKWGLKDTKINQVSIKTYKRSVHVLNSNSNQWSNSDFANVIDESNLKS